MQFIIWVLTALCLNLDGVMAQERSYEDREKSEEEEWCYPLPIYVALRGLDGECPSERAA